MDNNLVSIIVPVYNVENYLSECLESLINQTYSNLQIICVDDASTDGSLSILKKYASLDRRIKIIINEKNEGQAFSRNVGFAKVEGKYTYYLDSDDYLKLDAIEKLYYYAEEYNTDAIYFNSSICGESEIYGKGPNINYEMTDVSKIIYDGPTLFKMMNERNVYTNSVWRRFWKTEFLTGNNLKFENTFKTSEDFIFSICAILLGERMMVVNDILHVYRRHEGSITTSASEKKHIFLFKSYCMFLQFWNLHQFAPDVDDAITKYLRNILITAKRLYFRNKDMICKDNFKIGIEQHLFETIVEQKYEKTLDDIDEKTILEIRKYKHIIVYGAYIYAAEVVEKLQRRGFIVDSLAITYMHEKAEGINGIAVHEIKDLCYMKEDAIVILGVDKKNRQDVIKTLSKYGFMNYISLG